jgi:outer membrane lipoprotein-sorting protein
MKIAKGAKYCRIHIGLVLILLFLIAFSYISNVYAIELPTAVSKHYDGQQTIYWKIRQISISPLFDQPETVMVQFHIQKSNKMYITMPKKMIYTSGDTVWVYLPDQKQVQKQIGDQVFNPFSLIDNSQQYYKVLSVDKNSMRLKRADETVEPESLEVSYLPNGRLGSVSYFDVNENEIRLEFTKESFSKKFPTNIFLKSLPKDVQVIDLNEP